MYIITFVIITSSFLKASDIIDIYKFWKIEQQVSCCVLLISAMNTLGLYQYKIEDVKQL